MLVRNLGLEGPHEGVKVVLASFTPSLGLTGLLDSLSLGKLPLKVGKLLRCIPVLLYLWGRNNLPSASRVQENSKQVFTLLVFFN